MRHPLPRRPKALRNRSLDPKNAKVTSLVSPPIGAGTDITETPASCLLLRELKAELAFRVAVLLFAPFTDEKTEAPSHLGT